MLQQPTSLSAVHTNSTTINVYWSPPLTVPPPTGYNITIFAGSEKRSSFKVIGSYVSNYNISGLDPAATYHVNITSVNGTNQSEATGPVLAARGEE